MEHKIRLIDAAVDLYHEKPWDLFDAHEVFELDKVPFAQHVYCLFTMNSGRKCIRFYHGVEAFYDISDDSYENISIQGAYNEHGECFYYNQKNGIIKKNPSQVLLPLFQFGI